MAKSKTALAVRRGPSPALAKAREQAAKTAARLSKFKREVKESQVPQALMHAGLSTAGGSVAAALTAVIADEDREVAGIPVAPLLGVAGVAAGAALGSPALIHGASGALAWYAGDLTYAKITQMLEEE